jgi:preprotein translocase subunit SecD
MKWMPLAAAAAMVAAVGIWLVASAQDSGTELGYQLLWDRAPADLSKAEALTSTKESIRRRFDIAGLPHAEVLEESGALRIKLPGATPEQVALAKRLLRTVGNLQLRPAATLDLQDKFNKDGIVPAGYAVIDNPLQPRGGEYEAWGKSVLLRIEPVIRAKHIAESEPRQEMIPGGARWVTTVVMNPEGATRFDQAATELYGRRPAGLIGIVLDGELKSMPSVQSPAFHGMAQISGAKSREDAADLAIILRSGELVVPLGSRKNGKAAPGDPEFERPYGPKK